MLISVQLRALALLPVLALLSAFTRLPVTEVMARQSTYFVTMGHPSASDTGPGSRGTPWKTISRAMQPGVLAPGDTLVVGAGVYRESVMPSVSGMGPASRIVIMADNGAEVIISGADLVPSGSFLGSDQDRIWIMEGYEPLSHPGTDALYARDLLVFDGRVMMPVFERAELAPDRFFVESPLADRSRILFDPPKEVSDGPENHTFELGIRSHLFRSADPNGDLTKCGAPESAGWLHVIGLTFVHAANKAQSGAVCSGSRGVILEDVTVQETNGLGILVAGEDHVLARTRSLYNGQSGIGGSCTRCRLVNTESSYNNWRNHDPFWEAGGGKWAFTSDLKVIRHLSVGNDGPGFWLDGDNTRVEIVESRFEHNLLAGIMVELRSDEVRIVGNTVNRTRRQDWSGAGILIQASSGVEVLGNRLERNDGAGIWLRSDDRERGGQNHIAGNELVDNVLLSGQDRAQFVVWGKDESEVLSNMIFCNVIKAERSTLGYVVQTDDELLLDGSDMGDWNDFWDKDQEACEQFGIVPE